MCLFQIKNYVLYYGYNENHNHKFSLGWNISKAWIYTKTNSIKQFNFTAITENRLKTLWRKKDTKLFYNYKQFIDNNLNMAIKTYKKK